MSLEDARALHYPVPTPGTFSTCAECRRMWDSQAGGCPTFVALGDARAEVERLRAQRSHLLDILDAGAVARERFNWRAPVVTLTGEQWIRTADVRDAID